MTVFQPGEFAQGPSCGAAVQGLMGAARFGSPAPAEPAPPPVGKRSGSAGVSGAGGPGSSRTRRPSRAHGCRGRLPTPQGQVRPWRRDGWCVGCGDFSPHTRRADQPPSKAQRGLGCSPAPRSSYFGLAAWDGHGGRKPRAPLGRWAGSGGQQSADGPSSSAPQK